MKLSQVFSIINILLLSVFCALGVSIGLGILTGHTVNPIVPGLIFLASTFIPKEKNVLGDVSVEIWADYIIGNLFKGNEFLNRAKNADEFVMGGSLVHIPQAGAKPQVVKNRDTFPATAVRRSDTTKTYPLDVFSTDPTHIPDAELMEISYDKIDSVLGEHMEVLRETIGDEMAYKWAVTEAGLIIRTSGAEVDAHAGAGTGTRLKFTKEDLKKAQTLFNNQNISKENRVALVDSEFLDQLQDDPDLKKRDMGKELDMKNGVIARLYGFDILERSSVNIYDNAGTPVPLAPGEAGTADDNAAALLFQKNSVERALGDVDFFENIKDAQYYGDVYSAQVKFGGRIRRGDNKGIAAIVQAHPAA